jgi:hypothetical protein
MSLILSGTDGLSDIDGSAATPAIRGTDANTGIFFGTDIIGFSEGGVEAARINADSQFVAAAGTAALPVITTTGDLNTGIFFPAADTIAFAEGGAEAMRISSAGNLGIGNTSPASTLSVGTTSYAQATSVAQVNGASIPTSNAAGIFNIGSTDAAAADVGGSLGFTANGGVSGYPAGQISCRRDSATSSVYSTYLAFTTCSSGGTLSEKMRIDTSGNLTVPAMYGTTVTTPRNVFIDSTGKMGGISSLRASKNNITNITDASWLYQISPVTFNYRKRDKDENYLDEVESEIQYGLIAEDVEAIKPEFCIYVEKDGQQVLQGIHYDRMISPLIKALQQQQALITALTARIEALESN